MPSEIDINQQKTLEELVDYLIWQLPLICYEKPNEPLENTHTGSLIISFPQGIHIKSRIITEVKIAYKNVPTNVNDLLLHVSFKMISRGNTKKEHHYIPAIVAQTHVMKLIEQLIETTPKADIEKTAGKNYRRNPVPEVGLHLENYWNDWEQHDQNLLYYDRINDPLILSSIHKYFEKFPERTEISILDIGAGTGRLACKVINAIKEINKNIKIHYVLLEPSKEQCASAYETLSKYNSRFCEIRIVNKNIQNYSTEEKFSMIISSGGPISQGISTYDTACCALEKISKLLTPEGCFLASARNYIMFNRKEFKKLLGVEKIYCATEVLAPDPMHPKRKYLLPETFKQNYFCIRPPPQILPHLPLH